eukprot:4070332-Alexandrium_andersonii.AAC.1
MYGHIQPLGELPGWNAVSGIRGATEVDNTYGHDAANVKQDKHDPALQLKLHRLRIREPALRNLRPSPANHPNARGGLGFVRICRG